VADALDSPVSKSSLRGSETILVVDDEEVVRNFCSSVLTRSGYNVLAAEDGHCALEMSKVLRDPVHLALLDVQMPSMSGPELLVALLECLVPRNLAIRFILMSGCTDPGMVDLAHPQQTSYSFLQKPFTSSDLLEMVRRELDGTQYQAKASAKLKTKI